jgi:hypothetical protein
MSVNLLKITDKKLSMFLKVSNSSANSNADTCPPLKGGESKIYDYEIQIQLRGLIAIYSTGSNEVQ